MAGLHRSRFSIMFPRALCAPERTSRRAPTGDSAPPLEPPARPLPRRARSGPPGGNHGFHASIELAEPHRGRTSVLALRRGSPSVPRALDPMAGGVARDPPSRRGVRNHRGGVHREDDVRPELPGRGRPWILRALDGGELGVDPVADDLPRGVQYRVPNPPPGVEVAPHPRPSPAPGLGA